MRRLSAIALVVFTLAGVVAGATSAVGAVTERVSVSSAGDAGNDASSLGAVSADGRFVVFSSSASNLVPGDTNESTDVFVRDRATGVTERVNVSSTEGQAAVDSGSGDWSAISANGRFVVFNSSAPNLIPGERVWSGVYLRDRVKGVTERISESPKGAPGNGWSGPVAITPDGHFVAFASAASNLVRGDTNRAMDVFVWNRRTDVIRRVSVSSTGHQANSNSGRGVALSADGRLVAFESKANNLVAGDTNHERDIFVHNRATDRTRRMSISSTGVQADQTSYMGSMSADGRLVTFSTYASNLVSPATNGIDHVYTHNRVTGRTRLVDMSSRGVRANYPSYASDISADGRFVAFASDASNLVAHDTNEAMDIFVRDRTTNQTRRVSVSTAGQQANGFNFGAEISADGRVIGFSSEASNLVPGGIAFADVFVRVRG